MFIVCRFFYSFNCAVVKKMYTFHEAKALYSHCSIHTHTHTLMQSTNFPALEAMCSLVFCSRRPWTSFLLLLGLALSSPWDEFKFHHPVQQSQNFSVLFTRHPLDDKIINTPFCFPGFFRVASISVCYALLSYHDKLSEYYNYWYGLICFNPLTPEFICSYETKKMYFYFFFQIVDKWR